MENSRSFLSNKRIYDTTVGGLDRGLDTTVGGLVSLHPAQPPVLTRSQFCLCLMIQRDFIESLIRDLGRPSGSLSSSRSPAVTASRSFPFGTSSGSTLSSACSEYLGQKKTGVQ